MIIKDTITLINPNDPNDIWVSGNRGRRPLWVQEILNKDITVMAKVKQVDITTEIKTNGLSYWKWIGVKDLEDDFSRTSVNARVYVAASTPSQAIIELNKTFRNPVSMMEFSSCWKKIEPDEFTSRVDPGVWEMPTGETEWRKRKILA